MIQTYPLGDMIVAYVEETDNKSCGMLLYPAAMENEVCLDGNEACLDGKWRRQPFC